MFKIFCYLVALSIIFEGQTVSAAKPKKLVLVPAVFHSELTSYKIEPNNNFIEEKGNGLIQWKKAVNEGPNGLEIYSEFNGKDMPIEDLCKKQPQTIFPLMLKRLLGIESCPINQDTLSLITNNFSRPGRAAKDRCEKPEDMIFKLYDKKEKKSIMTFNIRQEDIKLEKCDK